MSAGRVRIWAGVILATVSGFLALMGASMARYPGGTWFDRGTVGHACFGNFLCDLVAEQAINGQPNPAGSQLAWLAFLTLTAGILPVWWLLPELARDCPRLGRRVRGLGMVGTLVLAAVPQITSERCGHCHTVMVTAASLSNFGALAVALMMLKRSAWAPRWMTRWTSVLLLASLVAFGCYAPFAWRGELGPPLVPLLQKVATLVLLGWMLAVALAAWARAKRSV
jgi:hypothetical protein